MKLVVYGSAKFFRFARKYMDVVHLGGCYRTGRFPTEIGYVMFLVFLNNKLISADSFAPLALEVSRSFPSRRWRFFVFDRRTLDAIQANPLIFGVLSSLGSVELFTDHRRAARNEWTFYRLFLRIRAIAILVELLLITVFLRPTLIHFRALNAWPLKLLYLLNRRRTHIVQPSAAGSTEIESRIERTVRRRRATAGAVAASVIVHYGGSWDALEAAATNTLRIKLPAPFTLPSWVKFVRRSASEALQEVQVDPDREVVAYMLNTMSSAELLDQGTSFLELFRRTLLILAEELPDLPVLVKRHPATVPEVFKEQERIARDIVYSTGHKILFSNIHPQILATRARVFVGNWYSSTFLNAVIMGVPTFQFSVCSSSVRQQSQGQNIRPDLVTQFFDDDETGFRNALCQLRPIMIGRAEGEKTDGVSQLDAVAAWVRELGR
jgi:hypothetical protein